MAESVKIIENGIVVTCDALHRAGRYSVLVKDDRIAELNLRSDGFKVRFPAAEVIDASDKILFPGFIDPHYHGESFLLKNWTAGFPLSRWAKEGSIRKALSQVYRRATKDDLAALYRTAYFSALKSGVTFISEFCFDNLDAPFLAAREAMKRADLRGFIGIHNGEQIERARSQSHSSIQYASVLPNEDDLTTYNLQSTLRVVNELKWPMVSHLGETRRGLESLKKNFQRSIVRVLDEYRVFQQSVHLVHLACLEEGDEAILAGLRMPVIVNPTSLLSKRSEVPPIALFLSQGIPLALCSDWGSSDPFENIKSFSHLLTFIGIDPVDPLQLIEMHTTNAARALHVQHDVGSIEPGKKADITFADVSDVRIHQVMSANSVSSMLQGFLDHASAHSVSDVMINGEFFIRKGQIMTYAEEDLKREYREMVDRLMKSSKSAAEEPVDGLIGTAAPILQLVPLPSGDVPAEEGESAEGAGSEPFDEGFRIVGKTGSMTQRSIPSPQPAQRNDRKEQAEDPKPARKVFGEDDL